MKSCRDLLELRTADSGQEPIQNETSLSFLLVIGKSHRSKSQWRWECSDGDCRASGASILVIFEGLSFLSCKDWQALSFDLFLILSVNLRFTFDLKPIWHMSFISFLHWKATFTQWNNSGCKLKNSNLASRKTVWITLFSSRGVR